MRAVIAIGSLLVLAAAGSGCGYTTPTREPREGGPTRTPGPSVATPLPTPTPIVTPAPVVASNLVVAKRRAEIPVSYDFLTLDEIRTLPMRGPDYTSAELAEMRAIEARAVWTEGELIYFVRVADGASYERPSALGDWHLEIREPSIKTRGQSLNKNVIVEITPHFQETHAGWNETGLRRLARFEGETEINPSGALVRIYGWLLNDVPHEHLAGIYRGTSWEIHPITRIQYFDTATAGWLDLY